MVKLKLMKKIVLAIFGFLLAFLPVLVKSQTFTMQNSTSDTVYATYTGSPIHDDINPITPPIYIKWHVVNASNFPADWLADSTFGICDASVCRSNNLGGTLWNGTSGNSFISKYPDPLSWSKVFDLNLTFSYPSVSAGTHWITINLLDTVSSYSKNITFIVTKTTVSVPIVANNENEVLLYPNPAHDEVNVVYDANADIRNIAVYNIIGKVMAVYKVTGPS